MGRAGKAQGEAGEAGGRAGSEAGEAADGWLEVKVVLEGMQ